MRAYAIAALLAGVLFSLDFDPVNLPYAAIGGVAAFFVIAHRLDQAGARWGLTAVVGFAFGLGFLAPLIWWMHAVSYGAYVALALAEALFFVPTLIGLRLVTRVWWWPVAMPAVWVLAESTRAMAPFSGFPWGRLAHTTVDSPLAGYVRWVGMPATSFIVGLVAVSLAWLAVRPREAVLPALGSAAAILLFGSLLPVGLAGAERGGSAQVSLVQGNIPGSFFTWKQGDIFNLHVAATEDLVKRIDNGEVPEPDVVLWPENSTDIDPFRDEQVAAQIERLSGDLGAPILVGGLFDGPTVSTAYNAGVVWTSRGPENRYVKRKVVPYGEYVPFRQALGPLVPKFDRFIPRDMLPGDKPNVLSAGGVRVGDAICWDIAFDRLVREAVDGGAQMLVVQTSNASFTGTPQPEQQFKISRLRAIETGRWVLVPSTNGISGIIDATGQVVARAPMHAPATLSASVPIATGSTLGVLVGGWLEYALMLAGIIAVGWSWRRA